MDLLDVDREADVSFIWKIQNYKYCFQRENDYCFGSPTFVFKDRYLENWSLHLYPKRYFNHDNIKLELRRNFGFSREIILEISVHDVRGSFQKKFSSKLLFESNRSGENRSLIQLKISKEELDLYLNRDSLTIKCKIWDLKKLATGPMQYYAQTIIGVKRITYPCTLEGFEEFESGANIIKQLKIYSEDPSFAMSFASTSENYAEQKIQIKIELIKPNKNCYSTCKILLVDAQGNLAHSVRDEYSFDASVGEQVWTYPLIEVSKILNNKKLYLTNGVLRLRCEFVVTTGVKYNEIERIEHESGSNPLHSSQPTDSNPTECLNHKSQSFYAESLKDNLHRFYIEGRFSDLTVRTPSKEFRVHKTILCARSEVFSAMFDHDMKENREGIVEIKDVNDDTVSKMLLFLYTDTVGEDLVFETASSLYFAADKYGIAALRRMCVDFLKNNFTAANVCDILVLADMHQNDELKTAAQSFIFEHSGEVIDSELWIKFMKEKLVLASEIMHAMLKKTKKP